MILRTIHVGAGSRAQPLLEAVSRDDRFKPVAIIDSNTTAAKVAQYRLVEQGGPNLPVFSGLTGALTQIEADAMIIASPVKNHVEFARMAFTANLHVLLDRPMASDLTTAKQLYTEADAAWVKLCIAHPRRYGAAEQTVAAILQNPDDPHNPGGPGGLSLVDWISHGAPMTTEDYPQGAVWEPAIEHLDTLLSWIGRVRRVTARSYHVPWSKYMYDANIEAQIEYDNGVMCNYHLLNDSAAPIDFVALMGGRGTLVMTERSEISFHPRTPQVGAAPVGVPLLDVVPAEQTILSDFFHYAVENTEPGTSARRNLRTVAACDMLIRSADLKRTIDRADAD